MSEITRELARFATGTKWGDLPAPVVKETKLVLMEHLGTALAALSTDKGKMMAALGKKQGGTPESSIIGLGDKVSCSTAALVNGELMIALDYSSIIAGGHDGTYVLPTILAMAETVGASGKDIILTTALGLEISARLARAVGRHNITPEDVRRQRDAARGLTGNAYSNFGAAAGASRLLKFGEEKTLHAMGIAGHLCMVLSYSRWGAGGHKYMAKYGVPGWQSTGAVTAIMLADMGYTGDTTVLDDPKRGFANFAGYPNYYPEVVTADLGKNWIYILKLHYKPYPCCGAFHSVLDCLYNIIEPNNLMPEEIESVKVSGAGAMSTDLSSISAAQFNMAYNIAVAAHRVRRGVEWVDPDTMKNPSILKFMEKVTGQGPGQPQQPNTAGPARGTESDPMARPAKVEMVARGKTFTNEVTYRRGDTFTDVAWTEKDAVEKFQHNAERILTKGKTERAVNILTGLENLDDISRLMREITL
ncbi:MAG: MmgE/PrpD family protein [Chloroflexota bacterium]